LILFNSTTNLYLYLQDNLIPRFFPLLQQGFMVKARVGCSIKTLLCQQLGLNPEYLETRIQTIFLDGKPVDNVDSATVKQGSTLALSAALPGLVGATLRKGSYYASMRSQISHREEAAPEPHHEGMILLKLFNLILKELGPIFLKQGVWINGKDISDFFTRQSDDFWTGCKGAKLDGEKIDLKRLKEINWADTHVFLQLRTLSTLSLSMRISSPTMNPIQE
jgi:hypothetical protein